MSAINWTKIYQKYKGLWVALLDDETTVVGHGKTLKEASDMAQKKGYNQPIFTRMPPNLSAYAGGAL